MERFLVTASGHKAKARIGISRKLVLEEERITLRLRLVIEIPKQIG